LNTPSWSCYPARATGVRIGELVDLELDCVHETQGQGAWLKVPVRKLDSERMVPLDDEAVALVDRIVAVRSPGRPLPHPRHGRPVEFLLTHHGKRLSPDATRAELAPPTRPGSARSHSTSCATLTPPRWSRPASACKR